ncbi:MAG: single-stranded DNA-binding protein [Thermoguttaceae bacterium]
MASFNRVVLVGNLTRDPELRYLSSGTPVTDIGLAVNDRRKSQTGEWIEETTFVDVTLWSRQAEIASEYLSKGSPALIEGRLKLESWEADGQKRSKLKVVGDRVVLLSSRGEGGTTGRPTSAPASASAGRSAPPSQQDYYDAPPDMGDVPF